MKLRLPAADTFGIAVILATVLALAGFLSFPYIHLTMSAANLFGLGIAGGAFLGVVLAALRLDTTADAAVEAGTATGGSKSIFVGNLAYRASKEELQSLFAEYGEVHSVRIMTDRMTRRPRGFGFVEMDARGAAAAIKALDGKEFHGRELKVNEGSERRPRGNEERSARAG